MPEQLIHSEVPAMEPQRQEAEKVDAVELTMKAEDVLRAATLDEAVRQPILDTLHFLELPIKDPSEHQQMGVDATLLLREKYPVLMKSRDMAIEAVKSLVESSEQGGVLPDDARIAGMALAFFVGKQKEYDAMIIADTSSASPETIADVVIAQSTHLRDMLGLAPEHAVHLDVLLANLKESIPAPFVAVAGEGNAPFLHLQHHDLMSSRKAVLDMLRDYITLISINPGDKVTDREKAIILEGLFQYAKKKEAYLTDTKADHRTSGTMNAALFSGLGEVAEELAEDHLDKYLGKIKGIQLAGASARVRAALARAGMTQTPAVLNTLLSGGGAGAQVLRETLRAVTPQSYASLLFYAMYLHSAEDKTRAFLSYSMFMGAGQALDLAPSAFASIASRVPALAKFAPRLAKVKLPMIAKVGILMLAAWGFSDQIEWALDSVERNADPLAYDISGNVIGVITAPLDVLPMYGVTLGTEDPMRDQTKYLTYEAGISHNWSGTTFNHRIEWWDKLVDGYAREETNPVRKKLLENERIAGGPGGVDGWTSRRAFAYFKDLEQIRGMEQTINEDLQSIGIGHGLVNLSFRLTNTQRDTGDRNVREAITYLEPYDSMYADIDRALADVNGKISQDTMSGLVKKREELQAQRTANESRGSRSGDPKEGRVLDPVIDRQIAQIDWQLAEFSQLIDQKERLQSLRKTYQTYEALARRADQDRSDYIKLGIISDAWFKRAPAGPDGIMPNTPDIVRRGMLSEMVYQSRRREALQIPRDESTTVPEHSGQLRENYDPDGPPSIMLEPAGWLTYFAVTGRTWDKRQDTETSHDALNLFTERLSQHVPREKYDRIFAPFVKAILEQRVAKYDPHAVIGPLASEFADAMFDGHLRSGAEQVRRENERSPNGGMHLPNLLVFGEDRGLSEYPFRFRDSELPVIACSSQLSPDCNVRSVMQFQYDEVQDHWTVETTSVGTIDFRTGGLLSPKGNRTENGTHRKTELFSTWRLHHPFFAAEVIGLITAHREKVVADNQRRETEQREGRARESEAQIAAREKAKQTPGVWIEYPHFHTEFTDRRHERVAYIPVDGRDKGYFAYIRMPEVTTGPAFRSADPQVVQAIGSYHTTRIEVVDERTGDNFHFDRMHGDYAEFFNKQQSSVPLEVLIRSVALPVPENPTASVRNILGLFVKDIDDAECRDMEALLLRQYEPLKTVEAQTKFLSRLENLCRNQTRNGKIYLTKTLLSSMLAVYQSQLTGGYENVQWNTFIQGDAILGVVPDAKGIYTVEKSGREGVTPIYVMFDGTRWKWHPGVSSNNPTTDTWYDVDTVNIRWKRPDGQIGHSSPVSENVTVLRQLKNLQR